MRRVAGLALAVALVAGTVIAPSSAWADPIASTRSTPAVLASGSYVPLRPVRLVDTRIGFGGHTPGAHGTIGLQVGGRGGVPASDVAAVVLTVTVARPRRTGHLTAYPDGTSRPATSTVNFGAGVTLSNLAVVGVGADGRISLYNASPGKTPLIVDVSGYYPAGTPKTAGSFVPVRPARLMDTRIGLGGHTPGAHGTIGLQVGGRGGVPASGVAAVILTVTVAGPRRAGHLTAYPAGTSRPGTSTINFSAGVTLSNLAVVRVGAHGRIRLQNASNGSTPLIVDVSGYYQAGTPTVIGSFVPVRPARLVDTRIGSGGHTPLAHGTIGVQVTGHGGIPASGVAAVVLTVTVATPRRSGRITAYADGTLRPGTTTVSFAAGATLSGLAVVDVGAHGRISLHNASSGRAPLVVDVSGYYRATSTPPTWHPPVLTDPRRGFLTAVSCPTTSFCVAVDAFGNGLRFDGKAWTAPARIDATNHLRSVSCVSATFCVAVDESGYAVRFDGVGWTGPTRVDPAAEGTGAALTVSCVSASFCVAVDGEGGQGAAIIFDGASWGARTVITEFGPTGLSCTSTSFCMVVDIFGHAVRFNGTTWSAPTAIDPDFYAPTVSCVSATFCVAAESGFASRFNGSTWGTPIGTGLTDYLSSLSCGSTSFCMAVDGSGKAAAFTSRGWSAPVELERVSTFMKVACASASFCVAVDGLLGDAFQFNGTGWGPPSRVDPTTDGFASVSCASAAFCIGADEVGGALEFDGSTWRGPTPVGPTGNDPTEGGLRLATCVSRFFCAGFASTGAVSFDGSTWTATTKFDPVFTPSSMSCPTVSFCVAVAGNTATVFNGTTWSAPTPIAGSDITPSVSCASPSFCIAVDFAGSVFQFNGTTWTPGPSIDPNEVTDVACPSVSLCVAVDVGGGVVRFNGSTWTPRVVIDPRGDALASVSCESVSFCVVVHGSRAVRFDGATWTAATNIDPNGGLRSVSCPSPTFCMAADFTGNTIEWSGHVDRPGS